MAKFTSSISKQAGALMNWVDDRLPVTKFWNATMKGYMAIDYGYLSELRRSAA